MIVLPRRQGSWTFTARDREERDMWIDALVHAIPAAAATFGEDKTLPGGDLATSVGNVSEMDVFFSRVFIGS